MSEEDFITIKPRQMNEMSFRRIKGVNFKFDNGVARTTRSYNYLCLSIGMIPIGKLKLKHKSKVHVSYHSKDAHIIKIKKISSKTSNRYDANTYSLSGCGSHVKNGHLRLRLKWKLFEPPASWFGKPKPAKYEIKKNELMIYLR